MICRALSIVLAVILAASCAMARPGYYYSPLDDAGRAGPAFALLSHDTLPEAPASSIRGKLPAGYQPLRFDCVPAGGWLWNRTHLIGSLLGGSSALNNLVTATQHTNQALMYPLEAQVYAYLAADRGRVLLAVVPVYRGDEAIPRGLWFLAVSNDLSLFILRFLPNVQPRIVIDYSSGLAEALPDY